MYACELCTGQLPCQLSYCRIKTPKTGVSQAIGENVCANMPCVWRAGRPYLKSGLSEGFHANKPLLPQQGFNNLPSSLRSGDPYSVVLLFECHAGFLHTAAICWLHTFSNAMMLVNAAYIGPFQIGHNIGEGRCSKHEAKGMSACNA